MSAVEERPAPANRGEQLAEERLVDGADDDPAGPGEGDRGAEEREAAGVVRRPVEGIDDPEVLSVARARPPLLGEDPVVVAEIHATESIGATST